MTFRGDLDLDPSAPEVTKGADQMVTLRTPGAKRQLAALWLLVHYIGDSYIEGWWFPLKRGKRLCMIPTC